jgi:hypothetical protein
MEGIDVSSAVPLLGPRVRPSIQDDFLGIYPKKKLEQLESLYEEGTFVVSALIDSFVEGESWWYPACKCHRGVTADSGSFYCKGCVKHVNLMIPRYVNCVLKVSFNYLTDPT